MKLCASSQQKKSLTDALRRTIASLERDSNLNVSDSTIKRLKEALLRRISEAKRADEAPKAVIVAESHE